MRALYITLIVVFGLILIVSAALSGIAYYIQKKTFGSRHDKNPVLKYFTAEDFGLNAKQVDISCVKNEYIRGVIYKKEGVTPKKDLIIFCHGMGPGHIAYTTEIAYFCNLGYTVFAPDYYGCNLSDGKSIKNIDNGLDTVTAAIYYARENLIPSGRIFLVGHSWGGHSALCAAERTGEVNGVVSISAPDRSEKVMYNTLRRRMPRIFADMLYPFLCLVCGGGSSAEAAEWCGIPVLLIHGEKDSMVPIEYSAFGIANGEHISKYLAKDKRHNPYNTVEAENKLRELLSNLSGLKHHNIAKAFFEDFDFVATTEEDPEVMGEIARFLSRI